MGNAVGNESYVRRAPEPMKGNAALYDFIEDECPILNKAMLSSDQRFRNSVMNEFKKVLPNEHFESISDIMNYMELKRRQRIEFLKSISEERFSKTPAAKFPCIAIRVNGRIAMSFMDTGCGMSCLTHRASIKLGLEDCIVQNVKGLATGFGNHTNIIGIVPQIVVQIGEMLFHVDFLVVEKASADFIIFGADFIVKNKLKLDFKKGDVIFPRRVLEEKSVRFIPAIKDEKVAVDLIVRMVENMNVPRILGFLPDVVNQRNVFINVRINGIRTQIMIDSGAEASMITRKTATDLKLFKFADLRMHRVSHGLGPVVIIGRIPPIPVEFDELTTLFIPFDVLNGIEQEMLILGSDFLTYYGCQIDFVNSNLHISLDTQRSYKLQEKDNPDTSNIIKDCGLSSLIGLRSPAKQERQRHPMTDEEPIRSETLEQTTRSSPSPTEHINNSKEIDSTPKIFKAKSERTKLSPKKTTSQDEYITVSLESLSAVPLLSL